MRIARIELHEVGPFEDAVLEFPEPGGEGEVVLFEGPNGSGKTTIAQVIAVVLSYPVGLAETLVTLGDLLAPPHDATRRRMRGASARAAVTIEDRGTSLLLGLGPLGYEPRDLKWDAPLPPVAERLSRMALTAAADEIRVPQPVTTSWAAFAFKGPATTASLYSAGPHELREGALRGALSFGADHPASGSLGQFLTNLEYERVQAKLYATEKPEREEAPRLQSRAATREASLHRIKSSLSHVLDRKVDIDFPIGEHAPRILFDGEEIPIDLFGEGLRNTVSWLSDLLVRLERTPWALPDISPFDQEFWLILDEIEESLHPTMQARILPALRDLFPRARIYATTHSPFVVASLGEGHVFSIRPDPKTHRVRGPIKATPIEHGRSLEWVVEAIFNAPSGFVDDETREKLAMHLAGITALRRGGAVDWDAFLGARAWLLGLNEEVRAVVASREVPVRDKIAAKLQERAA